MANFPISSERAGGDFVTALNNNQLRTDMLQRVPNMFAVTNEALSENVAHPEVSTYVDDNDYFISIEESAALPTVVRLTRFDGLASSSVSMTVFNNDILRINGCVKIGDYVYVLVWLSTSVNAIYRLSLSLTSGGLMGGDALPANENKSLITEGEFFYINQIGSEHVFFKFVISGTAHGIHPDISIDCSLAANFDSSQMDKKGNFYGKNQATNRVVKYDTTGTFILGSDGQGGLSTSLAGVVYNYTENAAGEVFSFFKTPLQT